MVVYDCFLFFNELDLLEVRLEELDPVVDKFVLVESTHTFSGMEKPLWFDTCKVCQRFDRYIHKIIHIIVTDSPIQKYIPGDQRAWINERYQRNQIARGLVDARPDDFIMVGDLDEIPRRGNLRSLFDEIASGVLPVDEYYVCVLWTYYYYINFRSVQCLATMMCTYQKLQNFAEIEDFRNYRGKGDMMALKDAGWHFGYLPNDGTLAESVETKIQSFSHQEYNSSESVTKIISDVDEMIDCRGRPMTLVLVDSTYPEHIKNNLQEIFAKGWVKWNSVV